MPKISVIPWIVKKLKGAIGIVEDTDTAVHAIASGKYVVWKGTLCKTTAAIAIGDTLSAGTGGNLAVVDDGGLNDVNGNIPAVYNGLDSTSTTSALSAAQGKALNDNKASKDAATQKAAGLMSATDKEKLDGIATGATAVSVVNNLNSDSTTSALSAAQGKALNSKITTDSNVTVINYSANSTIRYKKINGIVSVRVNYNASADGSIDAWTTKTLHTLPSGYRPPFDVTIRACADRPSGSSYAMGMILTTGEVQVAARNEKIDGSGSGVAVSYYAIFGAD